MNLRDFLGMRVKCDYIKIFDEKNNIIWEGEFMTYGNEVKSYIYNSKVIKWTIENNGIAIWVNTKED